jgi:hypothetical protein
MDVDVYEVVPPSTDVYGFEGATINRIFRDKDLLIIEASNGRMLKIASEGPYYIQEGKYGTTM